MAAGVAHGSGEVDIRAKELLHALLDDVVITANAASRTAHLVLHWKAGLISQIIVDLPKPLRPAARSGQRRATGRESLTS